MNYKDAVLYAIRYADKWMNGSVVVLENDGSYTAIPGANLSDVSYTGSIDVVCDLSTGLLDCFSTDLEANTAEDIYEAFFS